MGIRTVILGDVRLYREGLALSLAQQTDELEVVATSGEWAEALSLTRSHEADVVLVDLGMRDGLNAVRELASRAPEVRMVALALSSEGEPDVVTCAEAGIEGYLGLDASVADVVRAVEHAMRGEVLCSPRVAGTLVRRVADAARRPGGVETTASLTSREREIAELLDAGLSNKEIARRLSIRLATVKNHVHNILEKLQVRRRGEVAGVFRGGRRNGNGAGGS
jgi:two-component system, NarL family, nitrate/nitrite response regulator NarL